LTIASESLGASARRSFFVVHAAILVLQSTRTRSAFSRNCETADFATPLLGVKLVGVGGPLRLQRRDAIAM
jgi:hypothetical protein